jgi:hypothetical protein
MVRLGVEPRPLARVHDKSSFLEKANQLECTTLTTRSSYHFGWRFAQFPNSSGKEEKGKYDFDGKSREPLEVLIKRYSIVAGN